MILKPGEIESFRDDGFLIYKNFIDSEYLEALQKSIRTMAHHMLESGENPDPDLSELVSSLEAEDHKKVYTIQKTMATAASSNRIMTALNLDYIHHELYDSPQENIHLHLFQTPFQFPLDRKFDLSWHQESGSYGKNFSKILTCWFPVLGSVNQENGSVEIIPGSHRAGFRESTHKVYESGINDWVVTPGPDELKRATIVNLEPGDVLFFDSDLLHRSVGNSSSKIRVTGIARTIDICTRKTITVMAEPTNYLDHE